MYFWLFISVAVLLPSVVMLAMGLLSWRCPPKGVCWYFGYRSRRARASDEVWLFAQHFVGLLWTIAGGGLTLAGLILCYVLLGKDDVGRCVSAAIFLGIAAALVLGIILAAEIVLHVKFDRLGNRRLPKGELEQLRQAQAEAEEIPAGRPLEERITSRQDPVPTSGAAETFRGEEDLPEDWSLPEEPSKAAPEDTDPLPDLSEDWSLPEEPRDDYTLDDLLAEAKDLARNKENET